MRYWYYTSVHTSILTDCCDYLTKTFHILAKHLSWRKPWLKWNMYVSETTEGVFTFDCYLSKKNTSLFQHFYWFLLSCVFWLTSLSCNINSFNFSRCESKIIASASFVEKSKSNKTNNNFSTLSLIQIPVVSAWESPFNCNIPRTAFVCVYIIY